jgi:hypothetical protein
MLRYGRKLWVRRRGKKDNTQWSGGRCHQLLFIQPGITIVKMYTLLLTWWYQQIEEDGGMRNSGGIRHLVLPQVYEVKGWNCGKTMED